MHAFLSIAAFNGRFTIRSSKICAHAGLPVVGNLQHAQAGVQNLQCMYFPEACIAYCLTQQVPVADPRASTVPDVVPATSTATDSSPVAAASQSHTLSKGAIAGAVIGAVAGAVLFVALAALALTKVPLSIPARH